MAKNFTSNGVTGMNDVLNEGNLSSPQIVLNANVGPDGSASRRLGQTLIVNLPGAHSMFYQELYEKKVTLCMAQGNLYRLVGPSLDPELLIETKQPDAPAHYIKVSYRIYISTAYWTGVYNMKTGEVEQWGEPVPDAPVLLTCDGNLPNGRYAVVLTVNGVEGRISGNSRITFINIFHYEKSDENGGIEIVNMPDGATAWISDPDSVSPIFYRAGNGDRITSLPENPEPLATMWGSPPQPMTCITWAFGRMWGFRKDMLCYSESYQPELFKLAEGYIDLKEPGGMIAYTEGGLYVGTKDSTYFFSGRTPEEMVQRYVSPGVVPGSLCYASELGQLGRNVPIWIGKEGVYAGTADGQVINLLKEKINLTPDQAQGASIYRVRDGRSQMLFSFRHGCGGSTAEMSMGDDASCEVIRKGTII